MKENNKIYGIKTIGKLNNKNVQAVVCLNDGGEHLAYVIESHKEKYKNFISNL